MTDPFYVESGSQLGGLPLVLLHGFCETHQLWDNFGPQLSADYRVLCPDLPGFGKSSSLPDGFSLADVARRLAGWLKQLHIKECVVIGHSLGGYVALALLEHYPELLAGVGLFHSTAYADSLQKRRSRKQVIDFVEKHGVEVFTSSFVPQLFHHTHRQRLQEEIATTIAQAAATPQHTLVGYTHAMQHRPNRLPVLEAYAGPVLYIIGEKDTTVSLEDSQRQLSHLNNCEAYVLEDTSHMGMFEQREESLAIVKNFMRQVQEQKSS